MNDLDDLRATYGREAQFSEHKRGEHITYTSTEGVRNSGVIVWVQASFQSIGVRYVVAPDEPNGFVDFVVPGDVLQVEDVTPRTSNQSCTIAPIALAAIMCAGLPPEASHAKVTPKSGKPFTGPFHECMRAGNARH